MIWLATTNCLPATSAIIQKMGTTSQYALCTLCALLAVVYSQNRKEVALCLSSNDYAAPLSCNSPLKILVSKEITYGVNTVDCYETCCPDQHILCTKSLAAPVGVGSSCNGKDSCQLVSVKDIPRRAINCEDGSSRNASYFSLSYSCVEKLPVTTVETTTQTAGQYSLSSSELSTSRSTIFDNFTKYKNMNSPHGTQANKRDDMALVIGLSVAGGVIIIAIVVVIAVFTTRNRSHGSYNSQNSTKTLASSDIESRSSPEQRQSSEDVFGFSKSEQNQQQRLQQRNDNIKRNLSFKTEESKNKRSSKSSKRKSKSKSASLDKLETNNSPSKKSEKSKESNKNTRLPRDNSKNTDDQQPQVPNSKDKRITGNRKLSCVDTTDVTDTTNVTDTKSQTNLLDI